MERKPQNYANHAKFDPPFHFVLIPGMLATLILAITNVVRHSESLGAWTLVLLTFFAILIGFKARIYALKAQDRIIRLEERQRLESILSGSPLRPRVSDLSEGQLIALRFASDAECAGLVEKALSGAAPKDLKQAIVTWRPDYFRI
jgi:hypothetical protein